MAVGAIVARILTQYSDKGSKAATKDINKLGKSFDAFAKKSARAFGVAALAATAFAVKLGKDAVQAAMEDQKSQALLANSLRNTVGATDEAISSVEKHITALQKQFSVVDDELRPAFGRLTAAFGSTTAASQAMQIALNVSAFASVDLATASDAIIKASQGQYRAITKLVPGIGAATLATKDFGAITEKVSKLTGGAAATRAETLEGRMTGLKIAIGEVMETLGYALLPVLEKFATLLSTQLLPKIEAFVTLNKDKLAAGFQAAAEAAFKLLMVAVAFSDWCINNMSIIKGVATLIAGMFVVGRIAAFVTAIKTITAAMAVLRTTALGAAVASALASGGATLAIGAAALAALGIGTIALGNILNGKETTSTKTGAIGNYSMSGNQVYKPFVPTIGGTDELSAFLAALNKNTIATNKNTKSVMDIATENAMKELANRQKALSGSSSIALGGSGSKIYGVRTDQGVVNVNVSAGTIVGSTDALIEVVKNGLETASRRNGGTGGVDRYAARAIL
jgi:hypothetical protein